jgi:hypothetical protein
MNFQDLLTKIRSIDESDNTSTSPTDTMLTGSQAIGGDPTDDFIKDVSATECGGMMTQMSPQKQQDNVTMNVSMNGSGTGGIRDLMSILKNIEQSDNKDIDVVVGGEMDTMPTEEFANEPNVQTAPVSAVTPTGNDLASKGGEAPKVNGGGNPMREALVQKLSAHYQSIKEAQGPAMPDQPINRITQNVKPQANRPGLAPGGDPKLYDIQVWLNNERGYNLKTDGLNGPATKQAYDKSMNFHTTSQNLDNPRTASVAQAIGGAIGGGIDWIETAWRNLKQGFNNSSPAAPPQMPKEGIEEGGITLRTNADGNLEPDPNGHTIEKQMALNQQVQAQQGAAVGTTASAEPAGEKDLGNGFVLTSIEAFGSTRPAVLDTQSNTYFILNKTETGSAIARTPAPYLTIKDGQTGASMGGPMTNAAMKKAGLIKEAKEDKFDALKHVKNPTKGEKEAAKDVKRSSYKDRADMLKSAEADGRLKD